MKYFLLIITPVLLSIIYSSCDKEQKIEPVQTEPLPGKDSGIAVNEHMQAYLDLYKLETAARDSLVRKYNLFENWKKFRYTTYGLDSIPGRNILIDSLTFLNSYSENGKDIIVLGKRQEPFYFHITAGKENGDSLQSESITEKSIVLNVDQFRKVNLNDFIVKGRLIEIIDGREKEYDNDGE